VKKLYLVRPGEHPNDLLPGLTDNEPPSLSPVSSCVESLSTLEGYVSGIYHFITFRNFLLTFHSSINSFPVALHRLWSHTPLARNGNVWTEPPERNLLWPQIWPSVNTYAMIGAIHSGGLRDDGSLRHYKLARIS
jgi:hypothetical protein